MFLNHFILQNIIGIECNIETEFQVDDASNSGTGENADHDGDLVFHG